MAENYEFIDGEAANFPVWQMCTWAEVSTSGFYHWRSRPLSATARRRAQLRAVILQVFSDSQETYGYRRVHAVLQRMNVQAGVELVRALMRELGLVPCQPRPWRPITIIDDAAPAPPDQVACDFTADAPGRKPDSDITYVHTWAGFLYIATVIDCHTKAVVGWATADNMKTSLISDALDMAARNIDLAEGCIFHFDRGAQYTSRELRASSARWACRRRSAAPGSVGTMRWLSLFSVPSRTHSYNARRFPLAHMPAGRSSAASRCSTIENASAPDSATRPPQKSTPSTRSCRQRDRKNPQHRCPRSAGPLRVRTMLGLGEVRPSTQWALMGQPTDCGGPRFEGRGRDGRAWHCHVKPGSTGQR